MREGQIGDVHWQVVADPYPSDHDNPLELTDWKLYSFSNRHINHRDPDDFGLYQEERGGEVKTSDVGLRRKLDCGTAFLLDYFEHGTGHWSLAGTGYQCRFDTANMPCSAYSRSAATRIASWVELARSVRTVLPAAVVTLLVNAAYRFKSSA